MNVILLSAAHRLSPAAIANARAELGLRDGDLLWVVSWRRPAGPLRVDRHLLLGPPALSLRGRVTELETENLVLVAESPVAAVDPGLAEALAQETLGAASVSIARAPETGSRDGVDGRQGDTGAQPTDILVSHRLPPLWHPRRLRLAAAWRIRRLKRAVRVRAQLYNKGRSLRLALNLRISVGFAIMCWRAPAVRELAGQADLIVALDAAAYRGAWALTKRVADSAVMVGLPAGRRALDDRAASTPLGP